MKQTQTVNQISYCGHCNLSGFFCSTPFGADYNTCPCCDTYDFLNSTKDPKYDFLYDVDFDSEKDNRTKYYYCKPCGILFEVGCTHSMQGCTSSIYNGHIVKKWLDKNTGEIFSSMPVFENEDDWFNNVNNIQILKMYCPNRAKRCSKTSYPISEGCNC
jgi:hypothetical protein